MLTKGDPVVNEVEAAASFKEETVLALAAAAEADSEHPLAEAIVGATDQRGLAIPQAGGFSSSPAVGVTAMVDGRDIRVGGPTCWKILSSQKWTWLTHGGRMVPLFCTSYATAS